MALKHDDSTFSPTTYATAVIGSGTIGSRIALMLASGGGEVGLYDPNADQLKFREMLFDGSFRNSAASVNSLMTLCCSNFCQPFSSRPLLRSSIAALSAGTSCLRRAASG
jgi:2-polyprenyl-6-methoxyphenol hydroxylase-like FAD-dependent oxidoreductase